MTKINFLMLISIVLAVFLTILPLPHWAIWLRPLWLPLVMIYWSFSLPYYFTLSLGWMLGLMLDLLNGTMLGEHALAMAIIIYLALKLRRTVRFFPLWQQTLYVTILVFLYAGIIYLIQGIIGQPIMQIKFWYAPLVSAIIWPWLYFLIQGYRLRLRISQTI